MKVFTLGYQGLDLEAYVKRLAESGVGLVLDVREKPWSRKPGFSRFRLEEALTVAGIGYVHVRSAGNPSSNRKTAKNSAECLSRYRQYLRSNGDCLEELLSFIRDADKMGRPACLTCYEKLHTECHRSILLSAISKTCRSLKAVHL
jgi:uncharacterized protein (DUF488 family)